MNALRGAFAVLSLAAPAAAQLRVEPVHARPAPAATAVLASPSSVPAPLPPAAAPLAAPEGLPAPAAAADDPSGENDFSERLRSLNAFWDGLGPAADAEDEPLDAGVSPESVGLGRGPSREAAWLSARDPKIAAALDRAVALARSTSVGRRAVGAARKVLAAEGRTLPVRVMGLGRNHGEYDYVDGTLALHRGLFAPGREADLAGTLVHELIHVAQHALGIPSNALEMEIEAHLGDLEMMRELGIEPPTRTFARQAGEALRRGPDAFVDLLKNAVPGSPFLEDGESFASVVEQLEDDLDEAASRPGPRAQRLAEIAENDLSRLRSREGRATYAAFSKRVMSLLRRRAAEAARRA